jgi:general secretion pathway protein D
MRIVIGFILFLSVVAVTAATVAQEEPGVPAPPEEVTPEGPSVSPTPGPAVGPVPEGPSPSPGTAPAPGAPTGTAPAPSPRPTTTFPRPTLTRPAAPAGAAAGSDEELIPFNYENVQLSTIIKQVADRTGKNFLIQTPITGTVLIYSPKGIPARTAFDILGIVLDAQGYTMVVRDDPPLIYVTKKVGTDSIPTEMAIEGEGTGPEKKHELSTLIVVLKYVSVDDMQDLLRNFKSTTCVMTAYPAGNFLILKDDEAKLRYLLELVKKIDAPGTVSKVTDVELKHADATETANLIMELMAAREGGRTVSTATRRPVTVRASAPGGVTPPTPAAVSPTVVGTATPMRIIAEPRTNRLFILASEKDTEDIMRLVRRIDVEPREEMYPVRTYMAQYQDAADLADTLASFVTGQPRRTTTRAARTTASRTRTTTQTATRQAATAAPTPTTQRGPVAAGTEEAFFLADPATNMVLVQAAPQDMDRYMTLLKELDQPQKQVLIEVWIVEISSKNQLDIGVEFKSAEVGPAEKIGPMQDEVFGGTNFDLGLGNLLSGTGFPSSGISLGLRSLTNTSLDIGGRTYYVPNFDTFLRAMREDTGFNILSSPKLMALNNEVASVDVSDEISIAESAITSYATAAAGAELPGGYTETYRRTSVGISLEITPQINSENSVIMEIDLIVGSVAGVEDITQASSRPVIANRSTITKVRVDNGKTVVISGLRRADKTSTVSRVPILGQIPILGLLFSHNRTLTVNTNLLIFITPHVVSDTLDMLEMTEVLKNQDLDKERERFQPAKPAGKRPRPSKKAGTAGWDWKK